jgi:hypothetical protein
MAKDGMSMLVAKMTVITTGGEVQHLEPAVINQLGKMPVPVEARINDQYKVNLLAMNPKTHDIMIQIENIQPTYPMEVYFKPLTLFVWLGVGIMGVGGLLAALIRRKERKANGSETAA